jgi:hypothetical protein
VSRVLTLFAFAAVWAGAAAAQTPLPSSLQALAGVALGAEVSTALPPEDQQPATRQAVIEQAQAEKAGKLQPYVPNRAEEIFRRFDAVLARGTPNWHPFFQNAYAGGGFTLGLGRATFVSPYNYVDVRGSWTFKNYKRLEAEFIAPRLFHRRAALSVLGGWREATQVGFYGLGNDTSDENRTNYLFEQPYLSAMLDYYPTRKVLLLRGGVEWTQWSQQPGTGSFPSVETVYTPATLPGLGAEVTYLRFTYGVGLDWRTSPGYTRRGGFLAAMVHQYHDNDDEFGFRFIEYEAIQHIPILREAWVLAFRARVQTSNAHDGEQTPFFMLPSVGGGSSLRGYSSWRFRDTNSLLLQGEWRIAVNRYFDLAFFYDAGKVASRTADLDFDHLKSDWGVGTRFHGPFSTPLRIEIAKSREGLSLIFASSASF